MLCNGVARKLTKYGSNDLHIDTLYIVRSNAALEDQTKAEFQSSLNCS